MWNVISILILIIEVALLLVFIVGRFYKRRLNETALFIGIVLVVNFSLHLVPYLYSLLELKEESNIILSLLDCLGSSIRLFVGGSNVDAVAEFSNVFAIFPVAYALGVAIALITTISTAIEAFSNSITNGFRLTKALKEESCDIVIGNSAKALYYVKTCNSILLVDDSMEKEQFNELIESGYVILRKSFTVRLLSSRLFNSITRYNVICTETENVLHYIDTFIAYKKAEKNKKNIYLYVELEGERAEIVRREITEKNGMESLIETFSTNELLVRTFVEENPITKYLPKEYIEDAAIMKGTEINVFILGFDKLSQELYRQLVLNNQLVFFDGEYKVLPINYHLCDINFDITEWNIGSLPETLGELNKAEYFPIPEIPFNVNIIERIPNAREVLNVIKRHTQRDNSYTFIIINTNEDCQNIEIGARLKTMLFGAENYHIFVRSEVSFTENDEFVTYFGKREEVFNHDTIVNDSLSIMAKKLNEVYTARYADDEEKNRHDFAKYIQKKAAENWGNLDHFTLYSNIYSAMNLRTKLNLLGLDYVNDGKGANTSLIGERYGSNKKCTYEAYFVQSVRNALIAQEHARWNAYHLLNDYLPLEKNGISVKSDDCKKVRFNVKNIAAKKHACLTTYNGLNDISLYLAEKAGNGCTASEYDYYIYDEMLIDSADKMLSSLGYSVIKK